MPDNYLLIYDTNPDEFSHKINQAILNDYTLHGDTQIVINGQKLEFYQPMILLKKELPNTLAFNLFKPKSIF